MGSPYSHGQLELHRLIIIPWVRRHSLRTFLFRNHVFLHDVFVPLRRIQSFLEDVSSRISVFFTILMISLTLPCCHPLSAVTLFVICPFSIGSYTSCWTPAPQASSVLHQWNQTLHSSCRSRSQRTLHPPMAFIREIRSASSTYLFIFTVIEPFLMLATT